MIKILIHTSDGRLVTSDPFKRLGQRIAFKSSNGYRGGTVTEEALAKYGGGLDKYLRRHSTDPVWALWDGYYIDYILQNPLTGWMERGTLMLIEDLPEGARLV